MCLYIHPPHTIKNTHLYIDIDIGINIISLVIWVNVIKVRRQFETLITKFVETLITTSKP